MNLKQRYLKWHQDASKAGLLTDIKSGLLIDALQFCDDFMEQCDKLEREKRNLIDLSTDMIDNWPLNERGHKYRYMLHELDRIKQKGDEDE